YSCVRRNSEEEMDVVVLWSACGAAAAARGASDLTVLEV
ncbi:hypothetical protein A2U01_0111011, partial [Trifolium medium]|nr:hypothetical protein [Trifolium medium]